MKRASYREAVRFIAEEDEPLLMEVDDMNGMASVQLVACIFDVDADRVARDVIKLRKQSN